jgi:exoribonuclease-2
VPALGVHARGTKVMLDVMSIDELTVEASCRLLHVIDAPSGAAQAQQVEEEAEEEIIEAEDLSAESEAEAQAEAAPAPEDPAGSSGAPTSGDAEPTQ